MAQASSIPAASLWILTVIAALMFLRAAQQLLIPIALGVLLSYALEPVVAYLERLRIHRLAGTSVVLLVLLGLLATTAYMLSDDLMRLVEALPSAMERLREMLLVRLGPGGEAIQQAVQDYGSQTDAGGVNGSSAAAPNSPVRSIANAAVAFAGHLVVIFFLIFFLLISGHHVKNRLVEVTGPDADRRRMTATIINEINAQIQRYLLVLLVTAIVVALATWAALAWMGVEHALMWGILAGIFNSIPYLGPVIVSGGLFVVGLVQGGGLTEAMQMSGAAIAITSLEGWLLTPALMGKAERMSALTVFLGLLLWTWVWGAWGTILAVPMLVIIKSTADHVDRLKPLGRLMAP